MSEVLQAVRNLLDAAGVAFVEKHHEPTHTSEESARARGEPLRIWAKALVIKTDGVYRLFVLPADRKLASKQVRRQRGWRKLRFASAEEVEQLTGLAPGSIPPFGSLFTLPTLCDARLGENETINFNAGDHTISVSMRYADYVEAERPELGTFAE